MYFYNIKILLEYFLYNLHISYNKNNNIENI